MEIKSSDTDFRLESESTHVLCKEIVRIHMNMN